MDSDLMQAVYDRMLAVAAGYPDTLEATMRGEGTGRYIFITNRRAVPGLEGRGPGMRMLVKPDGEFMADFLNFSPPDWKRLMRAEGVDDPVARAEVVARQVCDWLAGFEAPRRFIYRDQAFFYDVLAERGEDGIYRERRVSERRLTPEESARIIAGA